jgi:hypothetical protein
VIRWLADLVMPWAARHAHVWPSQHAGNKIIFEQLKAAHSTVVEIHERAGAVCPMYDVCEHESCRASYTAWAIADQYLRDA